MADSGFEFQSKNKTRSTKNLSVKFRTTKTVDSALKRSKIISGSKVWFSENKIGTGSEGTEYELNATKPLGKGYFDISSIEQSESGEPNFHSTSMAIESLSFQ